jgi:hypothetical protein
MVALTVCGHFRGHIGQSVLAELTTRMSVTRVRAATMDRHVMSSCLFTVVHAIYTDVDSRICEDATELVRGEIM